MKPKILHLETNSWDRMQAATRLVEVQRRADKGFVIVNQVSSSSVREPMAKAMLMEKIVNQLF